MLYTLYRYIGREFLRMFLYCLGGFYILFVLVDLIERSRHLFKYGANFHAIGLYYLYKSPMIVFFMLPVAVLLGSLLTLAVLSKNSEVTAIKAGGVSVVRAVAPILALATLISVAAFFMNEYIVPEANQRSAYIYKTGIKKQKWKVHYKKRNFWYKADKAIYRFDLFVPEQEKIQGIALYHFDDHFQLTQRIDAESARYSDNQWYFVNAIKRTFDKGALTTVENFQKMPVEIPETPTELKVYQPQADQMSYRELKAYVAELRVQGYDPTKYIVELHGKISFPLVSIIMAILGIPFAIRHGRQGGMAAGIGIAVVLGLVYWIALSMMLSLGRSGALGPIVAAWGSHFLFGIAGTINLLKTK